MAIDDGKFVILAIRRGEVSGIVALQDNQILRDTVAEWALDPTVTSMIRAPLEIGRQSLFCTEYQVRLALENFAGA